MCTCHYLSICPPAGFIQCQLPSLEGIVEAVFCNNQPAEFLGSVVQVFICRGILGIINCYCGIGSVGKENKWTSNKVGVFVVSKLSMIIWHLFHLASNLWSFLLSASEKEPPPLLHYCNIYFLVFATVGYFCSFTASMLVVVAFFSKNLSVFCLSTDAKPWAALLFSSCHLPCRISEPSCFFCFQLVKSGADNRRGGTGLKSDELCCVRREPGSFLVCWLSSP